MSKFFINRPIVAMVISILTVIVGAVIIAGLPIAQFPNIVPPEIQLQATYVGADAQTLEQSVATPIEQVVSRRHSPVLIIDLGRDVPELTALAATTLDRPALGQVTRVHVRGVGVVGRATAIRS